MQFWDELSSSLYNADTLQNSFNKKPNVLLGAIVNIAVPISKVQTFLRFFTWLADGIHFGCWKEVLSWVVLDGIGCGALVDCFGHVPAEWKWKRHLEIPNCWRTAFLQQNLQNREPRSWKGLLTFAAPLRKLDYYFSYWQNDKRVLL